MCIIPLSPAHCNARASARIRSYIIKNLQVRLALRPRWPIIMKDDNETSIIFLCLCIYIYIPTCVYDKNVSAYILSLR